MKCPRCQQDNPPQAKFCPECATPLAPRCTNCGTQLPAGAKFCFECATPVSALGSPSRFTSPETYTPKHLAERIINSKAALEGERKQVTVLFADLKGSMELLADRDPEEARKILDPVLRLMMDAVHHYEGTVNQVMGDGIMALFGAPVAHEDHAVRACYAALRMQESVKKYAEEVRRSHAAVVKIRVGLNSGEVVVRAIGSDLRMDYTAVGQTTHLAARMEQLADPGAIVITPDTLALAEGYVEVKSLGPVPLKGLAAEVEVYEVTGAGPARTHLQAVAQRGMTRFVGRDLELEQLRQALVRTEAGYGQVVAIVGEPGVGKSRLVWEVTHSYRTPGWTVLHAGSVSYGKATPYLPIIELLREYFEIEDSDEPRSVEEKLTKKLSVLNRAQEGNLPALLSLLDVPTADPQWMALDPPQRRRRILDAVKQFLLAESQVQPSLVVFEDLHWIDSETQALLDELVETLPDSRLLLLLTYRPEYQHPWSSRSYYTQLRLAPLPPEIAAELLGALLGSDTSLEPVRRMLIARTGGSPFFLEESVRALVETGALSGVPGAYRVVRPVPSIQVPVTVQAVLAARIDRLRPADKVLLQTASAIGKDVPFPILHATAELADDELQAALGRLQASEFLYETGLFPDLEYTFRHALTHEVTYSSLLQDRRRTLHRQVVEAIERLYPDRVLEHIERLAHHAIRGEAWEKALVYARRAGTQAVTRSANQEAVGWFEAAVAALGRLPESRQRLAEAVDLRLALRNAIVPLGGQRAAVELMHETQVLAETLGDTVRLGWVATFRVFALVATGDGAAAIASGERAVRLADELGDLVLQITAKNALIYACTQAGDLRRAITLSRHNIETLVGPLSLEHFGLTAVGSVYARAWGGRCLAELGELSQATAWVDEAMELSADADHPFSLIVAWWARGWVYLIRGALPEAIRALEHGLMLARKWNITLYVPNLITTLARAYAHARRLEQAESLLAQIVPELAGVPAPILASLAFAQAHLLGGRLEAAGEAAQEAVGRSRSAGLRGEEAHALHLVGEVGARRDPPDVAAAEGRFKEAVALADQLGMRPSSPTATSASASSTAARTSASRPRSTSLPRRRCTARWA
jgi:class 3 adenylate cyclase/tetratricopeptide (TPR) repeat protein